MKALVCVGVLMALCAASFGEDKERSRDAYQRGTQHYDLGEFTDALEEFKEAYRNFHDPAFLFNIAQCYRQIGVNLDAIREYKAYLRNLPDAPNRTEVRQLIAKL